MSFGVYPNSLNGGGNRECRQHGGWAQRIVRSGVVPEIDNVNRSLPAWSGDGPIEPGVDCHRWKRAGAEKRSCPANTLYERRNIIRKVDKFGRVALLNCHQAAMCERVNSDGNGNRSRMGRGIRIRQV